MSDEFPDPHCLIFADGDVLIRNTLAEYVRNCGYKVFEAATSDEVMLALEEGTVKIDALLADAELSGGFNAFELRSEEQTSELQSLMRISYAVFCLKQKKNTKKKQIILKSHRSNESKPTE